MHSPLIVWASIDDVRRDLIGTLFERCGVPSEGVLVVLDDTNGELYPKVNGGPDFTVRAFCRARPFTLFPARIAELLRRSMCSHLVWISERVSTRDEVGFVWELAHELRHMQQGLTCGAILKSSWLFSEVLGEVNEYIGK